MSARQLVHLALLLARIPTNGATATSFGNDYCQDLGDRGVTCTLASSCTPATEVLLPNGATTIPLDVCTLPTGCTITPDVPSPSGVIDESMLDESMHPSSTTDVQQAPPPVDRAGEAAAEGKKPLKAAAEVEERFTCGFEGCGKTFATSGSARKHCRQQHLEWYTSRTSRNTVDGVARYCTWDEGKKRPRGNQLLASHGLLASQAQLAAMKPSSISDQRGVAAAAGKAARDAMDEHLDGGGGAGVAWKEAMVAGEAAAVKASEAAREREAGFMATKASLAEARASW